jgi:type IV pilus assembly protein PilP
LSGLVACVALTGCVDTSIADLEAYVENVLARPGQRPEELPAIEPYEIYTYQSANGTDPFRPFYQEREQEAETTAKAPGRGPQPDLNRNREELESHPLDALRMIGTLEQAGAVWGIVRGPDSMVHRIRVGNYMGTNHGKITSISEENIELLEIIRDGQGGWTEREASLALVE